MDMSGEQDLPRSRLGSVERPRDFEAGIPGCESVPRPSDTEFEAKVTAKVGPVRAKFSGKVFLSDKPAERIHHLRRGIGRCGRICERWS